MRTRAGRALWLCLLCALGGVASACAPTPSTTSTSAVPASTSTTTTTLPVPVQVVGTNALSPLGPIFRVPAYLVAKGAAFPVVPTIPAAATNVVKIGFRQLGSGPNLVLIMGEHGTMTWWAPQLLEMLASSYRVTIFDLPGVGYSEALPRPSIEAFADATAGLIDALGLVTPVVAGWGLGGEVALALAERHPTLATRLVLVDTSAGGPDMSAPRHSAAVLLGSSTATTVACSRVLFPVSEEAARLAWLDQIAEVSPDDIVASAVQAQAALQVSFAKDLGVERRLHTVTVPVLVVQGAHDTVFPSADATALVAGLEHAREVVLGDAGYGGLFQDAPRFVAALQNFTR